MFEDRIPAGATSAAQEVGEKPENASDVDFLKHEVETRIARSQIDAAEGRITRIEQQNFASQLRRQVREIVGTPVQG
jgi:hypothetical protein